MLRLLPLLLLPTLALAGEQAPAGDDARVHDFVPRNVRVSIALDHVWGAVRAEVVPADVGESSWAAWDRDGDGQLVGPERPRLASALRARELEFLCIAVAGEVLPLLRRPATLEEPAEGPVPLDARVVVRVEGRMKLDLGPGEHPFVLYDRPRGLDGVVPFRLSLGRGLKIRSTGGARNEELTPRRVEAVVSMFAPAVWGTVERPVADPMVVPAPLTAP